MNLSTTAVRRLRYVGIYTGVAVLLFWALAPIYWVIVSSVSTRLDLYQTPNKVWFPSPPWNSPRAARASAAANRRPPSARSVRA